MVAPPCPLIRLARCAPEAEASLCLDHRLAVGLLGTPEVTGSLEDGGS
jgi:hypothetical protein